ncbi:hypothetical protein [Brevibacterium paucivorans]
MTMNTGPQVPFYADAGVVAMMFVAPVSLILLVTAIVLVVFARLKPLHTTLLILLAVFVPILGPIIAIIIATGPDLLRQCGSHGRSPSRHATCTCYVAPALTCDFRDSH